MSDPYGYTASAYNNYYRATGGYVTNIPSSYGHSHQHSQSDLAWASRYSGDPVGYLNQVKGTGSYSTLPTSNVGLTFYGYYSQPNRPWN
jgi:hypothetical protein